MILSRHHSPQIQRVFRLAVLRRDDWTCQNPDCGKRGGRFEAHHVIAKADGGTDDLDNGICYCRNCHFDAHRAARTPAQAEWDAYLDTLK